MGKVFQASWVGLNPTSLHLLAPAFLNYHILVLVKSRGNACMSLVLSQLVADSGWSS
jgi:hypothetical protein